MFKIAVCDDEDYFRNELKELVSAYLTEKGLFFQVDTFSSGEEFIALGIEMVNYTILFMDINMNEISGITAAQKIREISKDVFIVFVTAYVNYTLEGYKVDAIRYLLKDSFNFQNSIEECMNAIIEKLNYTVVKKKFYFNEGVREIPLERLFYIESRLHKLEFHVLEDNMKIYTMYETLNKLDAELTEHDFIRLHQSFLVNMKYVKNIIRYKAVLTNGAELAIPKVRYTSVKEKFIAYQGEV